MNLHFGFSKQLVVAVEINKKEKKGEAHSFTSSSFLDGKLYVLAKVLSSPLQY